MSLTPEQIKAIRTMCEKYENDFYTEEDLEDEDGNPDIELVCAVADQVPMLLDALEQAQQEIERYRKALRVLRFRVDDPAYTISGLQGVIDEALKGGEQA